MAGRLPDKQFRFYMLGVLAFNVLPHALFLPPWVTLASAAFLTYAFLHVSRGWPVPSRWISGFFSFAGVITVWLSFGTIAGHEPATALLVYLASLKLLESTRYRDAMLLIFTCYFLLMAHLLNSQSIATATFLVIDAIFITALMFQLHKRDRRSSLRSFRPAFRLFLLAVPLWIFLFLAFPRFSAGLWKLNNRQQVTSGFSDSLNPGDVAELVKSDEIAFRARLPATPRLPPDRLYWRGAVLAESQGLLWKRGPETAKHPSSTPSASRIPHQILLEPLFQKWLFGLDVPVLMSTQTRNLRITSRGGHIFEVSDDLQTLTLIEVESVSEAPLESLSDADRKTFLQVPEDLTPQLTSLAADLEKTLHPGDTQSRVQAVLQYFERENFRYTLEPGTMTGLDQFLFEKRVGFCEHYAAAFATLLRLMRVPARVVVGFHGGELNEFGGFYVVRALDAHAWTEVYDPAARRWERVDPVTAVAPLRLQLGGQFNRLPPGDQLSDADVEFLKQGIRGGPWSAWLARTQNRLDAIANEWNLFLIRYDYNYQVSMLRRFGIQNPDRLLMLGAVLGGLIGFGLFLRWWLHSQTRQSDPLLHLYHDFWRKLERSGFRRRHSEGPLALLERARSHYGTEAQTIEPIVQDYIRLRYGREATTAEDLRRFRARVKAFKPGSPAPRDSDPAPRHS